MKLKSLYLRNFRNIEEAHVTFSPSVNGVVGGNGQGKTNLLEAIYHLITGRSFRTHRLADLVMHGSEGFYLEATFIKNDIEQTLKLSSDGTNRKIYHNATPLPTLSSLFGLVTGVILSPEDEKLISGSPQARRRYLDLQIAQSSPLYLQHLTRYTQALKQRNHLLRFRELGSIEIWENELARSAIPIVDYRLKAIEELRSHIPAEIEISLNYHSTLHESDPKTLYSQHREREIKAGATLFGPHRDDLEITLGGKEARFFASQGEKRGCAAALRLAEWSRLKDLTGEDPLMCVDDLGISLDKTRKSQFLEKLHSLGQVFITSPEEISCDCQIRLECGQLLVEEREAGQELSAEF